MTNIKKADNLNLSLNKNGLIHIKKFLNKNEKKKIINVFFSTLKKYFDLDKQFYNSNIESALLHKKLIYFRKKEPRKFSSFYDELNLNASLRSIFYSEKFLKLFSKILNVKKEFLFINGFMFRLDAPFDKRNVLDWHQDGAYYEQTYPSFNAAVCWIPVTNNSYKNGTVKYVPKFPNPFIKVKFKNRGNLYSKQLKCSISKVENKLIKNVLAPFGDIGIFHMNLKHKSGKNISKKFRLTIGCRFHDTSKNFNVGKEMYYFNKSKNYYLNKN